VSLVYLWFFIRGVSWLLAAVTDELHNTPGTLS
jgi:hypothetical protein